MSTWLDELRAIDEQCQLQWEEDMAQENREEEIQISIDDLTERVTDLENSTSNEEWKDLVSNVEDRVEALENTNKETQDEYAYILQRISHLEGVLSVTGTVTREHLNEVLSIVRNVLDARAL